MRLNVYLQQAGIGSRREAERMVADGRVTINGRVAAPTDPVAEGDAIALDGIAIAPATRAQPRLFMLYKPLDVLVTNYDSQGRATVFELPALQPSRKNDLPRLMSVGRLDVNSEGLLLLSDHGPLAQALMSPTTALRRVYRIRVHGRLSPAQINQLGLGITVNDVRYRGAEVTEERAPSGANTWYQIVLTEGKNREVRKLMEHFGCVVNRLIRIQYGPFLLGDLPTGALKEIPPRQVATLLADLKTRNPALAAKL